MYSPFLKESKKINHMAVKKGYYNCLDTVRPVRDTLEVINGKWKLPIIISMGIGNERFTDIQDSIDGLTPKVLAKELKDLEQHQLIKRNPIIFALKDWGINHKKKIFNKE